MDDLIKIRYCKGEVGWAFKIPNTDLAIVNNVSFLNEVHFGDVVRLRQDPDGSPAVDDVVLRQYPQQVRTPNHTPTSLCANFASTDVLPRAPFPGRCSLPPTQTST